MADVKPVYVKLAKEGTSFSDFHGQFNISGTQVKKLPENLTALTKSWIQSGALVVVTDPALIPSAASGSTPEPAAKKETDKQRAAREKKEAADAEAEKAKQDQAAADQAIADANKGEGEGEGEQTLEQILNQ